MTGQALALALPLCLVIVILIGAILWIEHEHRKERADIDAQHAAERDHLIQVALAPGAVQMAAMQAAMPPVESPAPDVYDEQLPVADDFMIHDLMEK